MGTPGGLEASNEGGVGGVQEDQTQPDPGLAQLPDIQWHNSVFWALEALSPAPLLVADAGFMYAAKMSGFASHYDLFTPDAGESSSRTLTRLPNRLI